MEYTWKTKQSDQNLFVFNITLLTVMVFSAWQCSGRFHYFQLRDILLLRETRARSLIRAKWTRLITPLKDGEMLWRTIPPLLFRWQMILTQSHS